MEYTTSCVLLFDCAHHNRCVRRCKHIIYLALEQGCMNSHVDFIGRDKTVICLSETAGKRYFCIRKNFPCIAYCNLSGILRNFSIAYIDISIERTDYLPTR